MAHTVRHVGRRVAARALHDSRRSRRVGPAGVGELRSKELPTMATNELTAVSPARAPELLRVVEVEHLFDRIAALQDRIAQRAFERFLERGAEPGHELEDWIAAERELLRVLPVDVETLDRHVIVRTQ